MALVCTRTVHVCALLTFNTNNWRSDCLALSRLDRSPWPKDIYIHTVYFVFFLSLHILRRVEWIEKWRKKKRRIGWLPCISFSFALVFWFSRLYNIDQSRTCRKWAGRYVFHFCSSFSFSSWFFDWRRAKKWSWVERERGGTIDRMADKLCSSIGTLLLRFFRSICGRDGHFLFCVGRPLRYHHVLATFWPVGCQKFGSCRHRRVPTVLFSPLFPDRRIIIIWLSFSNIKQNQIKSLIGI